MVFSTCIQQYLGIYCTIGIIGSTVYPGVITNVHPVMAIPSASYLDHILGMGIDSIDMY